MLTLEVKATSYSLCLNINHDEGLCSWLHIMIDRVQKLPIHPTGYRPQMMLQEGNVFIGAVCSRGGGREHQIHHEIGHMVGSPLPGYQTW